MPRVLQVLVICAQLAGFCFAADPPVFDYTRHYATLIVFEEHTCLSAYGLGDDDRLVMRFAAFTGSDEPWHGRTLRIEYHGCYDVQGVSYPWRARAWLTADTLILWDRLGSDPLPGTIWAWPHLGVEHPSPAEVLAATPPAKPDPNVGLEPDGPGVR